MVRKALPLVNCPLWEVPQPLYSVACLLGNCLLTRTTDLSLFLGGGMKVSLPPPPVHKVNLPAPSDPALRHDLVVHGIRLGRFAISPPNILQVFLRFCSFCRMAGFMFTDAYEQGIFGFICGQLHCHDLKLPQFNYLKEKIFYI